MAENEITSTSPPYWDTDDDDDRDRGLKSSELYGKYTWKIEKFSQTNNRELRWSHLAQFTVSVVNKDPKKSKYSDTLHRFWKKEHDWGWKKFMKSSIVLDGFVDADTLIIKAQVQVIRERADRPFQCLHYQYRRELLCVYLPNVEQICRCFVEEKRGRLEKLIEDKFRWSSSLTTDLNNSKIEVAYKEFISVKRQEELIREEEETWMAESEKHTSKKEKKSMKKQAKQKEASGSKSIEEEMKNLVV
ncbi:hypothetical protein E3N88_13355 [Mikania micrantha]|uniref:MATH domain-containing protein n=1 Tax=Mikania micrantha TaxID=192012 RepID=A0A5N6PB07_9ASTR|nr:hypothetical protein E3N88_13355 [Mikania micrantha]